MRGIGQYRAVRAQSASLEQLVLLMYEGALRRQVAAADLLGAGETAAALGELSKARAIFCELSAALDHTEAPELAANLQQLYSWCVRELAMAGHSGDAQRLDHTMQITTDLLGAWRGALDEL